MLRIAPLLVAAACLTACGPIDTLREGMAHSEAVSAELEKSLGVKSFVAFNWHNGKLSSVNVTFERVPPDAPLADIADKSRRAVVTQFKQVPAQILISFAIEPAPQ